MMLVWDKRILQYAPDYKINLIAPEELSDAESERFQTELCELLKFIKYFTPVQDKEIPPTSLLREFLGGSSFKY